MNDFFDKLWPAFEAEVSEQLDQLEQVLASGKLTVDVHFLFRQFHTLKSSSAMMGFTGMEIIAHAAEDLLDLVRKGQRAFDQQQLDVLLHAVDALRRQMNSAMRDHQPPAHEDAIAAEIRALLGEAEPPLAEPSRESGEAEDFRRVMQEYMGLATLRLEALALACADHTPLPDTDALAACAETAGLLAISCLLRRLQAAAPVARLALFDELLSRQRQIEALSGLEGGAGAASTVLRARLADEFAAAVTTASTAAGDTIADAIADTTAVRWLAAVQPLCRLCSLLDLRASHRLLVLVMQTLRDAARGSITTPPALLAQLQLALGLPAELGRGAVEDASYSALAGQLLDNIRSQLASAAAAPDSAEGPPPGTGLEHYQRLPPEASGLLQQALAAGHTLAEIDADLDLASDGGEAFIAWLTANGTMITNQTVFQGSGDNETTLLRFLVATALNPQALAQGLALLDPEGTVLSLRLPADREPAPARPATTEAEPVDARPQGGGTVRIDSQALDNFVNRIGELVTLHNALNHSLATAEFGGTLARLKQFLVASSGGDTGERKQLQELVGNLQRQYEQLMQADTRLQDVLGHLQGDVLALRVVPVSLVFNRMTRIARGLAQVQEKRIHVELGGEETRVDKGISDILVEPLTHLVRNAIDHGIESTREREAGGKTAIALLRLEAQQQGNNLLITVTDDGRGLDLPRILDKARRLGLAGERSYTDEEITQFIFAPGFSTSDAVTNVSGRGVGMDVVKTRITQTGGQIDVRSRPGEGTRFTLRLPLTVAIQNIILIEAAGRLHALPERYITELASLATEDLQMVQGQATCLLRGMVLPLYHLGQLLGGVGRVGDAGGSLQVVVLSDGRHRIGLLVEQVLGRKEVFVRDVHPDILRLPGVGGAAILGDGRVVVILDGDSLIDRARYHAQPMQSLLSAS